MANGASVRWRSSAANSSLNAQRSSPRGIRNCSEPSSGDLPSGISKSDTGDRHAKVCGRSVAAHQHGVVPVAAGIRQFSITKLAEHPGRLQLVVIDAVRVTQLQVGQSALIERAPVACRPQTHSVAAGNSDAVKPMRATCRWTGALGRSAALCLQVAIHIESQEPSDDSKVAATECHWPSSTRLRRLHGPDPTDVVAESTVDARRTFCRPAPTDRSAHVLEKIVPSFFVRIVARY